MFTIAWPSSPPRPACTATTPALGGTWSCHADLSKLGAFPGRLTFAFRIYDATGAVTDTPDGTRAVTYAVTPPKPTHTTYKLVKETISKDRTTSTLEYRATWVEPTGYASEFQVFELDECLRAAAATNGQPCIVTGMTIPAGSLRLLGTVSGDARSMKVKLPGTPGDGLPGPGPAAILLRASNAFGNSRFAILVSDTVCWNCTY